MGAPGDLGWVIDVAGETRLKDDEDSSEPFPQHSGGR